MPVQASEARLAASKGADDKRMRAREAVAREFFIKHIYDAGGTYEEVRRAVQCIDLAQPVVIGPPPDAPKRLVQLVSSLLGVGFFAERAPEGAKVVWWAIAPEAPYLKWFAPFVPGAEGPSGTEGDARYFVPAARTGTTILARRA